MKRREAKAGPGDEGGAEEVAEERRRVSKGGYL
jgi:hypothetical protein